MPAPSSDSYSYQNAARPIPYSEATQPSRDVSKSIAQGTVLPEGVNVTTSARTCTAEREGYIAHLTQCHSLGYIDDAEFAAREKAAGLATTAVALRAMTADLPAIADPEQDKRDAEAKAKKEKEANSFRNRWEDDDHFCYAMCALMCLAGVVVAVVPNVIASLMHLPQPALLWIGIPTAISGFALFIVGCVNALMRADS